MRSLLQAGSEIMGTVLAEKLRPEHTLVHFRISGDDNYHLVGSEGFKHILTTKPQNYIKGTDSFYIP